MREKYESLSLAVLRDLAKARGMKGISTLKKAQLIEAMLAKDETDKQSQNPEMEQENVTRPTQAGASEPVNAARLMQEDSFEQENGLRSTQGGISERENAAPSGQDSVSEQERTALSRQESASEQERTALSRQESVSERKSSASASGEGRTVRREPRTQGRPVGGMRRTRTESGDVRRERETAERPRREYEGAERSRRENESAERPRREYEGAERLRRETETVEQPRRENESAEQFRKEREAAEQPRREHTENAEARTDRPPTELAQLDSGIVATGILEVMPDGFGFIRSDNYLPGENDVYVSPSQIRKFNLKTGDIISGNTRIKAQQEKFSALLYLKSINGRSPSEMARRVNFEDMTPIFPNERLRMERGSSAVAMRIVDLFSPIGKGQRGMIVSPPKAGKTTLLKEVARSILRNDPKMRLLILLIDERPEEVTDIKEAICGENVEVIYSTFDELPEHHKRVSEMVIERAKRLVEQKEDVTILLDSITRLARAYNLTVPPSGRTLSGGLDPAALHMPKRFFGAARNMREGGSLTILATALVDTGSKMDDVVYEEFKGTGNMELVLDRKLSEKRVFPAIDIPKSGTRREDLLLDKEEQEAVYIMRRGLNGLKADEAVENILNTFVRTKDNRELVQRVRKQRFV